MQCMVDLHDGGLEALGEFVRRGEELGRLRSLKGSRRNPGYKMVWARVGQVLRSRPVMTRYIEARRTIVEQ